MISTSLFILLFSILFSLSLSEHSCVPYSGNAGNISLHSKFQINSVLNFGEFSYETKTKLSKKECLRISVFGGSISCWKSEENPRWDNQDLKGQSWPYELIDSLNDKYPCVERNNSGQVSGKHTIEKLICSSGLHMASWIVKIVEKNDDVLNSIKNSDIIFFDTVVNDVSEGLDFTGHGGNFTNRNDNPGEFFQVRAEILIRLVNSINTRASMSWIATSTRNIDNDGEVPRSGDSTHYILPVLKYFNIPIVSSVDGFGPLLTPDAHHWFHKIFKQDICCHPSRTGHQILGKMASDLIMAHFNSVHNPIFPGDEWNMLKNNDFSVKPPAFASKQLISNYLNTKALSVVFDQSKSYIPYVNSNFEKSKGWYLGTDNPKKPVGYFSESDDDYFQLYFNSSVLRGHKLENVVLFEVLRSYINVGAFEVTVFSPSFKNISRNTETFNCKWHLKVSEPDTFKMLLNSDWIKAPETVDMAIEIKNVRKNKEDDPHIKLFAVIIT